MASFRTLTEIYDLLSAENSDIVSENIATGVNIFGVEGSLSQGYSGDLEWAVSQPPGNMVDWPTAVSFCDSLSENGSSDWRLPTILELLNGYLSGNPGNTLGFIFNNGTALYWSNTVSYNDTAYAYALLSDSDGNLDYVIQPMDKIHQDFAARARCVHAGPEIT